MTGLARRLGLAETIGVSVAVVCPSIGMAFNVVLCVQEAGAAAPLAFLLGTAGMLIVALSFVAFSRRLPHAGSAYAYVAHAFGSRWGVLAGWTMLLTYLGFTSAMSALVADFVIAALAEIGVHLSGAEMPIAAGSMLLCAWLAWRDTRFASRLMLGLELASVAAILLLAVVILFHVGKLHQWSALPFSLRGTSRGLPALGYGVVYAIQSLAGFEGATTLSEETINPRRTVPVALIVTVVGSGAFYVFASYAVVLGFGLNRMAELGASQAPLDELARIYISRSFAVVLDVANTISAFSSVLGAITGAGRLMFALSRAGLSKRLAAIDPVHHTPARALIVCTVIVVAPIVICLTFLRAGDYYGYVSAIATLAVILVYGAVTIAETAEAVVKRRVAWALAGVTGTLGLAWALLCSTLPAPPPPANFWLPLVLTWVAAGAFLPVLRPALRRTAP